MRKLAFCFIAVAVSFLGCQDDQEINAIQPLLDTQVQPLHGNLLSSAWNRVNGFMFMDFNVNISGQYHFEIERVANYDQNATLNMAVTVYK